MWYVVDLHLVAWFALWFNGLQYILRTEAIETHFDLILDD